MSLPIHSALRLSGTLLAQHFRFRCDRKLRWEMLPNGQRDEGVPEPGAPRAGAELLTQAGIQFERRRVRELERRFPGRLIGAGWSENGSLRTLRADPLYRALQDPGEARWIVQPELVIPDPTGFALRHGFDPAIAIAAAKPDLIRVGRARDGTPRFGVVDIKWSRQGTLQHFAQVAFYSFVLEEICRQLGVPGRVDTRRGWLWTRGSRGPRPFALGGYRHHVAAFLREELPRVAGTAPARASWHVGPGCAGCVFFEHCRAEADRTDDVCRVLGITPLAREELRGRGVGTVASLQKAEFRRDLYTGCHALESNAAVLKARVRALAFGKVFDVEGVSQRMASGESLRVCLTAEGDPVSGRVFALGLRTERVGRAPVTSAWVAAAGTAAAEGEMLRALLGRLADSMDLGTLQDRSFQLFAYDRQEAELLRALLQRHLSDPEHQAGIAALAGQLLVRGQDAGTAPGAVLLDVIAELFALPIPYAWDLARVSEVLRPSEGAASFQPPAGFGAPFSSQISFERIHSVWSGRGFGDLGPDAVREQILGTVRQKLEALDAVIRAVRERGARRPDRPRLLMRPPRLGPVLDEPATLRDPLLERLRSFVELEAAEQTASIRQLHALTSEERAARFECIRGLERVETRADGSAVFEFDPACREVKFRPGDFALLLSNDDGRTLTSTHSRPWLARKLMVELVDFDLAASPPRVVLASEYGWERLERERLLDFGRQCVLDRADADFNTHRVMGTLRALDGGAGEFARAVLYGGLPDDWSLAALSADAGRDAVLRPAAVALGRPVLNPEQEEAWRAAFERPVSVVWGPPGTGKTYLLAWTLIGLAAAARAGGRPLRILLSAATHRAIVNGLQRVSRELAAAKLVAPLRLVKLFGRPNEADRDLEQSAVELAPETELARILDQAAETALPVLVGATPWSLWKQMRDDTGGDVPAAPMFDVVVIDEASQIRMADALIPLSSIRPGGRALLYGDDRQLAPIVRGEYGEEDSLFASAFTHLAERFGRETLRESRRMNRVLVRYPRRLFYPGLVSRVADRRLQARPATGGDPLDHLLRESFLEPRDAVVFFAYSGVRAAARNTWEAWLVARLAGLARGEILGADGQVLTDEAFRAEAFAVISPHRAQNSAILAELSASGWPRGALPVVDTVERMQGSEREMIVVSYGVADREYAEREAEFLLNPNRFNVAITRARSKLVVLVSREVLRAMPRDEQVMADSLALKGYPSSPGARERSLRLPGPDGEVEGVCYVWSLDGGRPDEAEIATPEVDR